MKRARPLYDQGLINEVFSWIPCQRVPFDPPKGPDRFPQEIRRLIRWLGRQQRHSRRLASYPASPELTTGKKGGPRQLARKADLGMARRTDLGNWPGGRTSATGKKEGPRQLRGRTSATGKEDGSARLPGRTPHAAASHPQPSVIDWRATPAELEAIRFQLSCIRCWYALVM